ncbi:MAG: hypothetical protein HQL64_11680 [Magnetococcales bacterium]|nr:hypothetical protein [Magnetococcales bacterium]
MSRELTVEQEIGLLQVDGAFAAVAGLLFPDRPSSENIRLENVRREDLCYLIQILSEQLSATLQDAGLK